MSRPIWRSRSPSRSNRSPAPWRSGWSRRSSCRRGWCVRSPWPGRDSSISSSRRRSLRPWSPRCSRRASGMAAATGGGGGAGKPVNVEFVSANPTGPLHVGHGRQAALGDAIAALLEWTGWRVTREFYYNDGGAQIVNLAHSVQARIRELRGEAAQLPEGGYYGEYIREIGERYRARHPEDPEGDDLDAVRRFAVQQL